MIKCMSAAFKPMGERIRELRKDLNLSQSSLAEAVNATTYAPGILQSRISDLERSEGEQLPSVPLLAALAQVLETNTDYLLGITNDPAPHGDLEDQVVLGMKDPELRAIMQEIADILAELPSDQLGLVREWLRLIVPKKPRIIGGE